MKKILTIALMAMSLTALAQHVTPISFEITDLKLDSLRDAYLSQPAMYRTSLDLLENQLKQNEADIKKARTELKVEQAHSKEMSATLNDAFKLAGGLRKTYEKEESDLIDMQKTIEKQLIALGKKTELNQETRESYTELLKKNQLELNYALREAADRKRAITDMEEDLRKGQNTLATYSQEVVQKAADLARLEGELKAAQATLKKEQKAAKSLQ